MSHRNLPTSASCTNESDIRNCHQQVAGAGFPWASLAWPSAQLAWPQVTITARDYPCCSILPMPGACYRPGTTTTRSMSRKGMAEQIQIYTTLLCGPIQKGHTAGENFHTIHTQSRRIIEQLAAAVRAPARERSQSHVTYGTPHT